ncbi:ABC transporter permease, partial [Streptomyces sp. TRM76130]|nr:ABC transporter permease [Streptomyces sp. TRM76130]
MTCDAPAPAQWRSHGAARRSTRALRLRVSAGLLALTVLAVLLVPPFVRLDQQAVDLAAELLPPSASHPFGTDDVGRDLL